MKKSVVCFLLVLVCCLLCAFGAGADTLSTESFTLTYSGEYRFDASYAETNGPVESHGLLLSSRLAAEIRAEKLDIPLSLASLSESDRLAYIRDFEDLFSDEDAAFLDTLTTATGEPFLLFSMKDEDGPYFLMEAIREGVAADFLLYARSGVRDVSNAELVDFARKLAEGFRWNDE